MIRRVPVIPAAPSWPADAPSAGEVLVLADASSEVEFELISEWARARRPVATSMEVIRLAPSRRRRARAKADPGVAARIRQTDSYLLPVRVVWSPSARSGDRHASWWDVLKLGDPRDPDALRQRVILARWPDRVTVVAGEGAYANSLLGEHESSSQSLTDFVTRRAWRALDRAERLLRGNRYKVPRFLHEEVTSTPDFTQSAVRFGADRGLSPKIAQARARYYLKEIAAQPSAFVIDLVANVVHWLIKQGYGDIVYDRTQVAELNALGREHALAFLPSHRSNLDRLSLQFVKWENDLPPNHTAGGINMNFFPVGPLVRRTGVFFIRRSFKDNALYKFVLQTYLDYLVENRFPLEWYLEGSRSRSGKLLPPRYGLLSYVVDSWRDGMSEDVMLVPVSISYDQIQDLGSYTDEARGAAKESESFGWALRMIRSLRRRYGNIHIRFGEAVSVTKAMGAADPHDASLDLAKLGLEVMHRIAAITPVSPAAVVSIALLSADGRARSLAELTVACRGIESLIVALRLPTTEGFTLDTESEVGAALALLAEHGNVSIHQFDEPIYYLTPEQALRASYYRNIVVHHFLHRAVLEMVLATQGRRLDEAALWKQVALLRDLLKFEFFFPEKEEFREQISRDLDQINAEWREATPASLLKRLTPKTSPWVVRPFLQSYLVVADELAARVGPVDDEDEFVKACLRRGEAYRLRGLVAADGVSTVLFKQALALARNRDLLGEVSPEGRVAFADEVRRFLGLHKAT